VLYLPPIHPIGVTNRKGRNNTLVPEPDDPVSWGAAGVATTVSLAVAGPDVEVW